MSTFITGKKFSSIIDIKKVLETYDGEYGSIDFFRFRNGEKFELDGTVGFVEVQFKGQDAKELLAFGTEEGRALPISYFHKRIKQNSDNEEIYGSFRFNLSKFKYSKSVEQRSFKDFCKFLSL